MNKVEVVWLDGTMTQWPNASGFVEGGNYKIVVAPDSETTIWVTIPMERIRYVEWTKVRERI